MDSFVTKAKTAFHSTAAKAEKVFTDIKKSDPNIDRGEDLDKQSNGKDGSEEDDEAKNLRRRPAPIKTKHDWHEKFKNIRIGKKGVEDPEKAEKSAMAYAIFDENLYLMTEREVSQPKGSKNLNSPAEGLSDSSSDIIPPIAVMKQLAVAIEVGKNFKSMRDLMASSKDSSPVRERASLSFSAVKSLVLREKEEKLSTEFGNNEKVLSVIKSLLDSEGQFTGWRSFSGSGELTNITSLPKDIHGAPPDSFVAKVSEAIGSLKTMRKMASFWTRIVAELRRLWSEGQYIPGIPLDEIPDLNLCLLYQQLQVINCCISRKKRQAAATRSLDSVLKQTTSSIEFASNSDDAALEQSVLFARISTGELVPRLGADKHSGLTMLETDEPIYAPVLQEMPLLTEDLIKETEEFVLRTGSVGAGCSQLLSDMQAFKAANPGCILEDFVRWHSPPDWMETDTPSEVNETSDGGDLLSSRGQLSQRMQKEGNLWRELWETAKPVPAVRQAPLFEEDLAVEGILNFLEDITPSELFEQLFISLLGTGFVIAEATLSTNSSLSKLFLECRNYIVATCQGSSWVEKVDDICQVYETVETMLLNPDEVINVTVQPEETNTAGELKNRFKRISLIFSSKDKNSSKTPPPSKDQKNTDEKTVRQSLTSIFSKKPPKPSSGSPADKSLNSVENDWTIV